MGMLTKIIDAFKSASGAVALAAQGMLERALAELDHNMSSYNATMGFTPLMDAAQKNNAAAVEALLQKSPDLEAQDKVGLFTAAARAAAHKDPVCLPLLLAAGANPNARGVGGATPLVLALRFQSTRAANLLLDAGADIETRNDQGMGVVSLAVTTGSVACAKLLIKRGALMPTGAENAAMVAMAVKTKQRKALDALRKAHAEREARLIATSLAKAPKQAPAARRAPRL